MADKDIFYGGILKCGCKVAICGCDPSNVNELASTAKTLKKWEREGMTVKTFANRDECLEGFGRCQHKGKSNG